ncbi:MAG: aldehyde dehydrogenase family protein [Candidatus Neomarinimicrobiota bacterium]
MTATIETTPAGTTVLKCFNPATKEPLQEIECHTLDEVEQVLEGLRRAADNYNYSTIRERTRLVRRFRKAMARNMDRIIASICAETGKKPNEALIELFGAFEIMRWSDRLAPSTLRTRYRPSGVVVHKSAYVNYRPHGVAAIISPWNYPLLLVAVPAVEALLAGNTVAAKPSEHTCLTGQLIKEIFDEATGRPELLEMIIGVGDVGQRLVSSALTDVVCFTGSTRVGRDVARSCAEQLKPVILELGGKDPMLVLEDANLARAAKSAVWGGFTNAGQTCISVERIYVLAPVYEEFVDLLRKEARRLTAGREPEDAIGAVTLEAQYDKVMYHLKDAESKGARVEIFGSPDGQHLPPALLTEVDHSMAVMTDETFGPELAVMKVDSEDEAIAKANDSAYGLSAYIYTGSERRGRKIARRLQCGGVALNDVMIQYAMASLPIGGFKASGMGKVHGPEGLRSFSRQQSVAGSRFKLPMELWWYDLGPKTHSLMRGFVKWWYS